MTNQKLYELKEKFIDAKLELEKIQDVVDNLTTEDKVIFDKIIIW